MSPLNRNVVLNVPNLFTFARIAVIPVIVFFLYLATPEPGTSSDSFFRFIAAFLFIAAGITDLVDGHFARKLGQVSLLGKFVDPMADKLVHMAVMVMLIPLDRMPAWFVVLILFRELAVNGLRAVAAGEGLIIAAGDFGKKKTALMNIGLSALILPDPFLGLSSYTIGWFALIIAAFFNVVSGVQYVTTFFRQAMR